MNKAEIIDALLMLFFFIRVFAILVLSVFMLLKALVFRRAGEFGASLAKSNLAVVVAFIGSVFLIAGFDFFATWPWSLFVLLLVMAYAIKATHQMSILYGGWMNLLREAKLTLIDMRGEWKGQPLGMKIAILILILDLFAAVSLTEVKGVPHEIAWPMHSTPTGETK